MVLWLKEALLWQALIVAGIWAIASAPLGCFLLWKRLSFFADAFGHSILFGIMLGFLAPWPMEITLVISCAALAILFSLKLAERHIAIISYTLLSASLMLASNNIDPSVFLFGDIFTINFKDWMIIAIISILSLGFFYLKWQDLLLWTLDENLAFSNDINVDKIRLCFSFVASFLVASGLRVMGALLVPGLLVIIPMMSSIFAKNPKQMVCLSCALAFCNVISGIFLSVFLNTPTGPTIVILSGIILMGFWLGNIIYSKRS